MINFYLVLAYHTHLRNKKLHITSGFNEVAEGDLGEERILFGKIAEGGRSEPLNSCYAL